MLPPWSEDAPEVGDIWDETDGTTAGNDEGRSSHPDGAGISSSLRISLSEECLDLPQGTRLT